MLRNLKKKTEGFTIIEVLIVLAIAGLIMLVVFLAVPALQRNSRNNARNNDASRIASAVTECLANRNGDWGSCNTDGEIEQGTMNQMTGGITVGLSTVDVTYNQNNAHVAAAATCDPAGISVIDSTNTRSFAVAYQLEPNVNRCITG